MTVDNRNLARKWRSKTFDQVVGQELSVRMLKNSLYRNQLFPVYLFSGQRGCGKTTSARLFAAALNCERLVNFQTNPQSTQVPCLECASCKAMSAGAHPDFIEMDAASNTGVDNVRTIIDAASLLPVMGRKKIYLIDEAHMLSKAAFNAFLKILEEPPVSVIFMLATTDPQKIIDTVRSRCFQLFFHAIDSQELVDHLKRICQAENIDAQEMALYTIVKETEGSARDALNLLEQVRFSHDSVTYEAVIRVLGHLSEEHLLGIFGCIIARDQERLLRYMKTLQWETYSAVSVWGKFQDLIRTALYVKYGASRNSSIHNVARFEKIVNAAAVEQLVGCLQILYDHELIFTKTTVQHGLLEVLFLTMCEIGDSVKKSVVAQAVPLQVVEKKTAAPIVQPISITQEPLKTYFEPLIEGDSSWKEFLKNVEGIGDPLLASLFKQAEFGGVDQQTSELIISFSADAYFFADCIKDKETVWTGFLKKIFGDTIKPVMRFDAGKVISGLEHTPALKVSRQEPQVAAQAVSHKINNPAVRRKAVAVDVSDKEKWKVANNLVEVFGGTVVEVLHDEKVE